MGVSACRKTTLTFTNTKLILIMFSGANESALIADTDQ